MESALVLEASGGLKCHVTSMPMSEDDDDRPRWRDADEDDDEPREWEEIEPEEEPPERGGVLGHTAPVARIVFMAILGAILVFAWIALKDGLARWFGG